MHSKFHPIFGSSQVQFRSTLKAVTPFGGLVSLIEFFNKIGLAEQVQKAMPFQLRSPNAIPPAHTLMAFFFSVVVGASRFAHTDWLRSDKALHAMLGISRFPGTDTIRNLFARFTQGKIQAFWRPLWIWILSMFSAPAEGFSLDLDSTILQRSGHQEGAAKGYNPHRPGRKSHHPLLAVLAETQCILHGWLRSGNTTEVPASLGCFPPWKPHQDLFRAFFLISRCRQNIFFTDHIYLYVWLQTRTLCVGMFISRIRSTGKNGRSYVSILLRESKRTGKKVASRTLAILTDLPQWLIAIVENAVEKGKEAASIEQLVAASNSKLGFRSAESFGAVFLVHEVAKACQIPAALGSSHEAKLALWQVCARALSPATSLLAMIRLASRCAASSLLGFRQSFNEDDLYANGSWVTGQQAKIEKKLWLSRPAQPSKSMFLYDVTSSYFEGEHNALAAFGYNRDKVKGKRQVVMGLLTDAEGEPASVSLFPGNTSDLQTFGSQVEKLKTHFGQEHITMVGDRGMIRGPQQVQTKEAGFHFISGLHKAEIETLLVNIR